MNDPKRVEVERLAVLTFKARQERIIRQFGDERSRVINRVTATGNAGGYLPALIAWAVDRLKQTISAQADSYIEAFNAFNMPCDTVAEQTLRSTAIQSAAGSIVNVRSDRSVKRHHLGSGVPWHLEIERESGTAVKEAISRMSIQRATVQNLSKEVPRVSQTFNLHGHNSRVNFDSVDNSVNVVRQGAPFAEVRKAIETGLADGFERASILERLTDLERASDKESGAAKYAAFIAVAANHMQLILPFLPILMDWIGKLPGS